MNNKQFCIMTFIHQTSTPVSNLLPLYTRINVSPSGEHTENFDHLLSCGANVDNANANLFSVIIMAEPLSEFNRFI